MDGSDIAVDGRVQWPMQYLLAGVMDPLSKGVRVLERLRVA